MKHTTVLLLFCILYLGYNQSYTFGIAPKYSKEVEHTRFKKVVKYLEEFCQISINIEIPKSYEEFIQNAIDNKYAIAYSAPLIFTKSRLSNPNLEPIISVTNGGKKSFQSHFLALKESKIKSINDIVGKKIAFGHKKSSTRYLISSYTLNQYNISFSDFKSVEYHQDTDESMIKLIAGLVDVVAVHEAIYKNYIDEVKIIHKSFKFPEYTFFINKDLINNEIKTRIVKAFLKADKSIARSIYYRYDGFAKANIKNYNHVQNVAKYHHKKNNLY